MATDKPTIPLKVWADCTQRFQDTLAPIAQQVQTIAEQQLRAIVEMWEQQIYPEIHAAYLADGAPYGDTQEGVQRWLHEMGEIRRHLAAIEAIRTRQWAVRDFRCQVKDKHS